MTPRETFRVARLFDRVDPERGPVFAPDHPRFRDPAERERLLDFLRRGTALMAMNSNTVDRFDPSQGEQVPVITKTDGLWIWNAGHTYYLEHYDLALEPEFHEHIRRQDYTASTPDEQTVRAAADFLRERQRARQE